MITRKTLAGICAMALGFAAAPAIAADPPTKCTLATLRGTMGWAAAYTRNAVGRAGSGFESYDGRGTMKYTQIVSDGYSTQSYTGVGTYTITADCIASVTYDGFGPAFVYFVAPDGSAYYWTNNQNTGVVSAGRVDRVSLALLVR